MNSNPLKKKKQPAVVDGGVYVPKHATSLHKAGRPWGVIHFHTACDEMRVGVCVWVRRCVWDLLF